MKEVNLGLDIMTQAELAKLATECLARLEPGIQPRPLFTQLARLVVTSTVEVVPFRLQNDRVEVLMSKRSHDDPWWPDQWHLPGKILLPTDEAKDTHDYDTPVDRLFNDEFNGTIVKTGIVRVFDAQRRMIPRGSEQTVIGWSLVDLADGVENVLGGQFFDVDKVEEQLSGQSIIEGHLDTVNNAIYEFRKSIEID